MKLVEDGENEKIKITVGKNKGMNKAKIVEQ